MREAVAMERETMGDDHPDVADGLLGLGRFLLKQNRCAEAEPLLWESMAIRERTQDAEAVDLAYVRLYLGECLVKLNRQSEAEPLLTASLPVFRRRSGDDSETAQRVTRALAAARRAR